MSDLRKLLGVRIRDLRKGHGLTQEQLGERAGVSYKFLGEVERGVGNPTVDWLESIALALDVNVKDLIADRDPKIMNYLPLRGAEYSVVREARDSLQAVLRRFRETKPTSGRKAKKRT